MPDLPDPDSVNEPEGERPDETGRQPAGFQPPGSPSSPGSPNPDPLSAFGNADQLAAAMRQVADAMSWQGGPVNWDLAKNTARQVVSAEGDPVPADRERREATEALRLADLWLNEVTELPSGVGNPGAWSRSEWIERTIRVWRQLCDPVAERMVDSLGNALPQDAMAAAGPMLGMIKQMGGMMVGGQIGQAIGTLAREVVGTSDIGLPLAEQPALIPAGVAKFDEGLEVPAEETRLYLALREAAHHRLFQHVPWLRAHLLRSVEEYARGITVDLSRLEDAIGDLDPSNPERLQEALAGGDLLKPEATDQQKAALGRLETTLALVEGWVATVTDAAATDRLPSATALSEAVRRRRATGGPAETTFQALVGLELRPRRLREAAALWEALREERGIDGRDAVWGHPDLMPSPEDLDDPDGFVKGSGPLDLSELDDLGEDQ